MHYITHEITEGRAVGLPQTAKGLHVAGRCPLLPLTVLVDLHPLAEPTLEDHGCQQVVVLSAPVPHCIHRDAHEYLQFEWLREFLRLVSVALGKLTQCSQSEDPLISLSDLNKGGLTGTSER